MPTPGFPAGTLGESGFPAWIDALCGENTHFMLHVVRGLEDDIPPGLPAAVEAADSLSAPVARAAAPLPPRTGDWQHLVGVRDAAAGELRLYVDGGRAGTAEAPAGRATTGPLALGRGRPPSPQDRFDGSLTQIRVWRRALSDTDVSAVI